MMELKVVTPNSPDNQTFKQLVLSLLKKAFSKNKQVESVLVVLSKSEDQRVPFVVEMDVVGENREILKTKAVSGNSLAAFSQALTRMERQLEKQIA